jgi:hypothetical protein
MKLSSALALLALAAAPALSSAATPFLIDFEKTWSYGEAVDNQYAAGGVTFTNVLGVSNDPDFGGNYYSNAPTMQGVAMAQLDGVVNTTAFMNVADGVEGKLSFFYSTPSDIVGAIKAYSGLNGTGTLLGTFDLTANASAYDVWTAVTFTFGGTAKSFDLTGTANVAGIDNISAVPEPSSLALSLASLGLIGLIARRRPV